MKKSYIIVLAMSELNRELAEVMRDLKAEPDFKYLQTKRDVIEGEIKTLYRILADLEEMEWYQTCYEYLKKTLTALFPNTRRVEIATQLVT